MHEWRTYRKLIDAGKRYELRTVIKEDLDDLLNIDSQKRTPKQKKKISYLQHFYKILKHRSKSEMLKKNRAEMYYYLNRIF